MRDHLPFRPAFLDRQTFALISYPTTPHRFAELVEIEGFSPAKYLARLLWVSAVDWSVLRTAEWNGTPRRAHPHARKLALGTLRILALTKSEQRCILKERKASADAKRRT